MKLENNMVKGIGIDCDKIVADVINMLSVDDKLSLIGDDITEIEAAEHVINTLATRMIKRKLDKYVENIVVPQIIMMVLSRIRTSNLQETKKLVKTIKDIRSEVGESQCNDYDFTYLDKKIIEHCTKHNINNIDYTSIEGLSLLRAVMLRYIYDEELEIEWLIDE